LDESLTWALSREIGIAVGLTSKYIVEATYVYGMQSVIGYIILYWQW